MEFRRCFPEIQILDRKNHPCLIDKGGFGSPCWTRTNDSLINSQVLYRLS